MSKITIRTWNADEHEFYRLGLRQAAKIIEKAINEEVKRDVKQENEHDNT